MFPKYIWDNIAQENYLCIVGPERTYKYTFAGKPAVLNMSDSLTSYILMTMSQRFQSREEAANKGETVMHIIFVAYLMGSSPDMTAVLGYTRKKKKKRGRGLRIWNFQRCQRNSIWNFQRLIKNEVEFPVVMKKKSCGISRGLGFWPWNFPVV